MSSSRNETRSLTRGAAVLLLISVVRYGGGVVDRVQAGPGHEPAMILDSLGTQTRAAVLEDERRSRPLQPGEAIDPNKADAIELDRLPGVGPSTAAAIVTARDTGLVFRRSEDLLEVRGIGPASMDRIMPFLTLGSRGRPARSTSRPVRTPAQPAGGAERGQTPIDLNHADISALEGLPGIGPALAARIVSERGARPFEDLDDLARVRGIGPGTVERLRGLAVVRRTR